MRILGVHSGVLPSEMQNARDMWRIKRPLNELSKHVDWQIDHVSGIIPKYPENKDLKEFTEPEMAEGLALIKDYDIVFSSYHPDPTTFTLLQLARDKFGVQFVMDVDDDMFAINPDNPFWQKNDHQQVYWMQRMIAHNDWIVTPSEVLAGRFRDRRPGKASDLVITIPNYISDDYKHPGFDNGDTILIGYMGGSSHYSDLHSTGVLEAVQKIMHEHKNVRFQSIGMFTDTYLPKQRTHFDIGVRGDDYLNKLFPTFNFDIALAPLEDNIFNQGKSDIKWQEYTRAGSPVIASNVGPYKTLKDGVNAMLVDNNAEAWYKAIKTLIDRPKVQSILVQNAQNDVKLLRLESNWGKYKDLFERVAKEGNKSNADHRTKSGLSVGQAK